MPHCTGKRKKKKGKSKPKGYQRCLKLKLRKLTTLVQKRSSPDTRSGLLHTPLVLQLNAARSALRTGVTKVAVRKSKKGAALKKWFKEEWVDVKTGKPCGRKSAKKGESKRPYPSCRPKAVAAKMTKAEKASSARRKTGPAKIKHAVTASGRRRKK